MSETQYSRCITCDELKAYIENRHPIYAGLENGWEGHAAVDYDLEGRPSLEVQRGDTWSVHDGSPNRIAQEFLEVRNLDQGSIVIG